jgi:hypothetical protein
MIVIKKIQRYGIKYFTLALVLLSVFAFTALTPNTAFTQDPVYCYFAGLKYSVGACRDCQRCTEEGTWENDATCHGCIE